MTRRNVTSLSENFVCLERYGGILKARYLVRQPERYALVYNADEIRTLWITLD